MTMNTPKGSLASAGAARDARRARFPLACDQESALLPCREQIHIVG
jgi:hypothetical protein